MAVIDHPQIIMAAQDRVAQLGQSEDGLYVIPGLKNPVPRDVAVQKAIRDLVAELSEGSASWKLIEKLGACKNFIGTVTKVGLERSSTRAKVVLFTGTDRESDDLPAGHEQVRTERTDDPAGRLVAAEAKALIGHRVLVWVFLEDMANGKGKVRVLQHVQDLGTDDRFDPGTGTVVP